MARQTLWLSASRFGWADCSSSTLALVLLVIAYAIFSDKLRRASDAFASIAQDQAKFLRATQRAYISVEPDGILMVPAC
jgi:hypothetical protein